MTTFVDEVAMRDSGAIFSPCRRWRYILWRRWEAENDDICAFIGLNPSTADETTDDPTVRRCIRFAKSWGYSSLWMLNAYAFRATDPLLMKAAGANALGPQNNEYIRQACYYAEAVVAAWGNHCAPEREREVRAICAGAGKSLHVLGLTQGGHPKHPLYIPARTPLALWGYHPDPVRADA